MASVGNAGIWHLGGLAFQTQLDYSAMHAEPGELPTPRHHRRRPRLHPQAHHRASRLESKGSIEEAVSGLELGAGQRRIARYGLPRVDADAPPRGPDRTAAGAPGATQSDGRS